MQSVTGFVRNATLLFLLWLLLSNRSEPLFIALGLFSAVAIAWLHDKQPGPHNPTIPFFRFMVYLPWLGYRIGLSNLHVARLILHPRLPIAPKMIRYRTKLHHPAAVALLANSITLTPGTITAEVNSPELVVHALDGDSTEDLTTGKFEKEIAWVFEKEEAL
ncbi:MAG: Na+/H+ antiporter subunit E [Nitrospiria bacterium]